MKAPAWLKYLRRRPTSVPAVVAEPRTGPLREFVYLDEVSLRSLLSSQKGEVTDATSEQNVAATEAELEGTVGYNTPLLAKGELTSRYQTSNSSTLQTSRKATVQSWFREFHRLSGLRRIEPQDEVTAAADVDALIHTNNRSIAMPAESLARGDLVEFRVRLAADPVYRFGTLMTEFRDMVGENPGLFAENNTFELLTQVEPVNRILQRLLAGLIPIRAHAIDYVAVTIGETEYLAHRGSIAGLDLPMQAVEIVGVTEHLAYWKDIRRVLFSEAEFTMLARVARAGLQPTWTPVKLAELFLPFAPDLVEQIHEASRSSVQGEQGKSVSTNDLLLGAALRIYKDLVMSATAGALNEVQEQQIETQIALLQGRSGSAAGQKSAFEALHAQLAEALGIAIDPHQAGALREEARTLTGLPLFPVLSQGITTIIGAAPPPPDAEMPRLLDVEVVSVYW